MPIQLTGSSRLSPCSTTMLCHNRTWSSPMRLLERVQEGSNVYYCHKDCIHLEMCPWVSLSTIAPFVSTLICFFTHLAPLILLPSTLSRHCHQTEAKMPAQYLKAKRNTRSPTTPSCSAYQSYSDRHYTLSSSLQLTTTTRTSTTDTSSETRRNPLQTQHPNDTMHPYPK